MKNYDTKNIRNICLVGHGGCGKTSLTEAMLHNAGLTTRIGKVTDGNTVSDYLPEEIQKQISISTSLIPIEEKGVKVNFLDTPGYSDFIGEVIGALNVAETGLLVLCGASGLEVQAEIIWDMMEEKGLPRIVFINKLDRENSSGEKVLEELRNNYPDARFVQMQIPVGKETDFSNVVDILQSDIPAEYQDEAAVLRESLVEAAAEADDEILMKYLEGEALDESELNTIVQKALAQNMIIPVFFGSAEKNIGIKNLLSFIKDYAPAPEPIEEKAALVFKTLADPYLGKMSFLKIFGGTFNSDSSARNSNKEIDEKLGQLFFLRGKTQANTATVSAGDIVVVPKLQETKTGDTLCDKAKPVTLETINFPEPCLPVAIRAKSKGDEDKLGTAFARILDEDPTLSLDKNIETKQTVLSGMGEMQLEIVCDKLAKKYGVAVEMDKPRVPFRETIKKAVKVEGKHKKQSGGHGQYGHVWIEMEPNSESEFEFAEKIFGGAVPKNYFPAVEKGLREAMAEGFLAGYPATNIKFTLVDGSYHSVDSSEMAFKLAAIQAFRKGAEQANPVLLEPLAEVEVKVPEEFMGDVIGDLNSKRGRVLGMEPDGKFQVVRAQVPQSEMMRYAIDLKSMTQGKGIFTSKIVGYEEVPARLAEIVIAESKAQQAD